MHYIRQLLIDVLLMAALVILKPAVVSIKSSFCPRLRVRTEISTAGWMSLSRQILVIDFSFKLQSREIYQDDIYSSKYWYLLSLSSKMKRKMCMGKQWLPFFLKLNGDRPIFGNPFPFFFLIFQKLVLELGS